MYGSMNGELFMDGKLVAKNIPPRMDPMGVYQDFLLRPCGFCWAVEPNQNRFVPIKTRVLPSVTSYLWCQFQGVTALEKNCLKHIT